MRCNSIRRLLFGVIFAVAVLGGGRQGQAHYMWLKTIAQNDHTEAFLFFGESAVDEAYHLPERLADTAVYVRAPGGRRSRLTSGRIDTEERIGLVASLPVAEPYVLEASRQYGIYGTSLLTYYAKHVHVTSNDGLAAVGRSNELMLDLVPRAVVRGVELTVLWGGRPLADADVWLALGRGEPVHKTTDDEGRVTWQPAGAGLAGVLVHFTDEEASGKLDGQPYHDASHYATLTFPWQRQPTAAGHVQQSTSADGIPPLPEPVASFGAAVADGFLYVYSGHTGTAHDHSSANLSHRFCRLRLGSGRSWEALPLQTPLQGLALVAHDGKLYRVGGMIARNATPADEEDLHSVADFACFDPALRKWTELAPLPAPRSSHDAIVIGDRLYVVGGWTLDGSSDGEWLERSLVYDFAHPDAGWQDLPEQPFRRRALAVGAWRDKLVALGGMDADGLVSQRVDVFDPATGRWSQGPGLAGEEMAGFGVSAWNLNGQLYVCGSEGVVRRLSDDGGVWEEAARLATPRFFHRLLPGGPNTLLVVGGASEEGHLADVEAIRVDRRAETR